MDSDIGSTDGGDAGSVSIGEEDQLHEIEMEHEQRQQDDGVPPPGADRKTAQAIKPSGGSLPLAKDDIAQDGADVPDRPGQTREGGLGGGGPVQP